MHRLETFLLIKVVMFEEINLLAILIRQLFSSFGKNLTVLMFLLSSSFGVLTLYQ